VHAEKRKKLFANPLQGKQTTTSLQLNCEQKGYSYTPSNRKVFSFKRKRIF